MVAFQHHDLAACHCVYYFVRHAAKVGGDAYFFIAARKGIAETKATVMWDGEKIHANVADLEGVLERLDAFERYFGENVDHFGMQM